MTWNIGLHTVTYAGFFYDGPAIPLKELFPKLAKMGYEGVFLMAKRPHANTMDLDKKARKELKEDADSNGIKFQALAAYTNFTYSDPWLREQNLLTLLEQIKLAVDLDIELVRVFAGGMRQLDPKADYVTQWVWAREKLKEAAKIAENYGVTLCLRNHAPICQSYKDCLQMQKEVGSDSMKIALDPLDCWWVGDDLEEAARETGDLLVYTVVTDNKSAPPITELMSPLRPGLRMYTTFEGTSGFPLGEGEVDLKKWVKALKGIGYKGDFAYEICGPTYVDHNPATIDWIDASVEHALKYMRMLRDL